MKYICELCGFVYDENRGDPRVGIPAGTPFAALPTNYSCRCGSEKEAFCQEKQKSGFSLFPSGSEADWNAMKYFVDTPCVSQR